MRIKTVMAAFVATAAAFSCSQPENEIAEVLNDAVNQGVVLYGHQDDLMYGHDWNLHESPDAEYKSSDVQKVCGRYPAILGLDLGGIELQNECNLDGNRFDDILGAARVHHARGGVVTLSWHVRNPLTGGDAWDVSSPDVVASVLPGGCRHDEFVVWMGRVADFIEKLGIPVIFRPWHEHTGTWFWWCSNVCTPEQYNALWKMTYDYMAGERGLNNMLWAISPNIMPDLAEQLQLRYPGDDLVDIVGIDFYQFADENETAADAGARYVASMRAGLDFLQKFGAEHHKLIAVTETGYEGIPDASWWTDCLAQAIEGYPVCYVLTWRNSNSLIPPYDRDHHYYAPWPGQVSADDFTAWQNSGKIKML